MPLGTRPLQGCPLHAYVGRQAIFDRELRVVAYELLYRDSDENRARFDDATQASASTLVHAFLEHGLDQLVGSLPVYVNLTEDFLLGTFPLPFPPERTVIEVLEDVPVTPALLEALRGFRTRGYRIALDDFVLTDATRPLVELADVIKVSVLGVPPGLVAAQTEALRPFGVPLLAEKISTHEEHQRLHAMGFELFQGHFLELPIIAKTRRLPHDRLALLQLLTKLVDPRADLRAIERLIAADVGLTHRLLRLATSVAKKGSAPIGTLGQALGRLGLSELAAVVVVVIAAGLDDKPLELARQALVRGRMCEQLARTAALPAEQLFTAGLLSLLDALLDRPLAAILDELAVTPLIRGALHGDGSAAARIIEAARGLDAADFERVIATGLPAEHVFSAWSAAVRWADHLVGAATR